jgi:ribosomal protein S18 acetylase RimI-like enzyme
MHVSRIRDIMADLFAPDTVIRLFKAEDFEDICSLEQRSSTDRYQASVFIRQSSELFSATFFVACTSSHPVGYTIGAQIPDEPGKAWILRLMVEESNRRQSIGKWLLEHVLAALQTRHVREAYLSVSPKNTAALNLYMKLGFKEVVFAPEYFGIEEDRLIFKKILSGAMPSSSDPPHQ